ncbi:MAG: hypothetical protein ACE144_08830 [Thermodesulfobacteriota bacterium]
MKKEIVIIVTVLLVILLVAGVSFASGWGHRGHFRGHGHSGFGIFIGPPLIWAPPPVYHRHYYPPPVYEGPRYRDPAWVPGHWEERYGPDGREWVWVPGYWRD